MKQNPLKLNMQYFADDGQGGPPATQPEGNPGTPPAQPGLPATPPAPASVDIEAIAAKASEKAEKKMESVFKSMLEQQGFDADSINRMTKEWKDKQRTPEQEIRERDAQISELENMIKSGAVRQELLKLRADANMLELLMAKADMAAIKIEDMQPVGAEQVAADLKKNFAKAFGITNPPAPGKNTDVTPDKPKNKDEVILFELSKLFRKDDD